MVEDKFITKEVAASAAAEILNYALKIFSKPPTSPSGSKIYW